VADIFREVDEEVRKEKAVDLWRRYGTAVVAAGVLIVLGVAGFKGWTYYQSREQEKLSDAFAAAMNLAEAGESTEALNALADLAEPGGDGYALLAAFERARLFAEAGDVAAASAIWDEIAASEAAGPGFRGIATLLSVLHQLDSGDAEVLRARLEPLASEGNSFRPGALELMAALALRDGRKTEAAELYRAIADDLSAPSGLRARAAQMLTALGE
jgi:hypothetical protein